VICYVIVYVLFLNSVDGSFQHTVTVLHILPLKYLSLVLAFRVYVVFELSQGVVGCAEIKRTTNKKLSLLCTVC
jgi:hypothetical protein